MLSCVLLFVTPWTVAHQSPLSMGFSRQDYWSGLPFASPGDLPDPGIKPKPSAVAAGFFTTEPPGKSSSQITSQIFQYNIWHIVNIQQQSLLVFWMCTQLCQLCPNLCDPTNSNPPGSSVHGILQARILEWVTICFSRGSS